MCLNQWKIDNRVKKELKMLVKEVIENDIDISEIRNERYKPSVMLSNRIYDTKKMKYLTFKDICRKLNRLEYYKGICFD